MAKSLQAWLGGAVGVAVGGGKRGATVVAADVGVVAGRKTGTVSSTTSPVGSAGSSGRVVPASVCGCVATGGGPKSVEPLRSVGSPWLMRAGKAVGYGALLVTDTITLDWSLGSTSATTDTAATGRCRLSFVFGVTAVPTAAAVIPAAAIKAGAAAVAPASPEGRNVSCVNHDSGPIARRSLPSEMLRNARTTLASNWVPAHRASSARAAAAVPGFL